MVEAERRTEMRLKWGLRRSAIIWLLVLLAFNFGCATGIPPQLPDELRDQVGTIGVVSPSFIPETEVPAARGKGAAASVGVAKGLGLGLFGATACVLTLGQAPEACLMWFGTPALIVVGAVEEAKDWMPETVEWQAERVLKVVLKQGDIQRTLGNYVLQVVKERTDHWVVIVEGQGPKTLDEEGDYRDLASQGIDTVLEVIPIKIGFVKTESYESDRPTDEVEGIEGIEEGGYGNWLFSLTMAARARLIRVKDNKLLITRTYELKSPEDRWSEWVAKDHCDDKEDCVVQQGQFFGEAVEQGLSGLAEQIVYELFTEDSKQDFTSVPPGVEVGGVKKISHRVFDLRSVLGVGSPEVKVQLVTPNKPSQEWPNNSPAIMTAFKEVDLVKSLQRSIAARLSRDAAQNAESSFHLDILLLRYGFLKGPDRVPQSWCLVVDGQIVLKKDNQAMFKDHIVWEPYQRSGDLSPPRCGSPDELAADNGRLARELISEASEVLAAVITRRFGWER